MNLSSSSIATLAMMNPRLPFLNLTRRLRFARHLSHTSATSIIATIPPHPKPSGIIPAIIPACLITHPSREGGALADGTIFRRPLQPPAIELSSPIGTQLFRESLSAGTAQCFFRLMEQLHTQAEPEYCGLATLVTVLNALNVDPHRRWKGNWRFYSEELLDCCEPLTVVKKHGIDFDKLASLASCNGLDVAAVRAEVSSEERFRERVLNASKTESSSLILAYSRKPLNQTGSGHYSPVGAYHAPSDHVLILDCARFKYRPHWAPLPVVFQAMQVVDPDTKRSRGYITVSPRPATSGPPPAAHVLALSLKSSVQAIRDTVRLDLSNIAKVTITPELFLSRAADGLETVMRMELSGHGCGSFHRKSKVYGQFLKPTWGTGVDVHLESEDTRVKRRALLFSIPPAEFENALLESGATYREEIAKWLDMKSLDEEARVEIEYARQQVADLITSS